MKRNQALLIAVLLAAVFSTPRSLKADPITFTLTPSASVAAGGSVTFFGSLSNGGSPTEFLTDLVITLTAPSGVTADNSAFFSNTPPSLASGDSVGPVGFFDIFADVSTAPGTYSGTAIVKGGLKLGDDNDLVSKNFSVTVMPAATPEPSSLLLLATGLTGAAGAIRRKLKR